MADDSWHQREDGSYWSIAGWDTFGSSDWNDVETEGATRFEDSGYDLSDLDRVTVHYMDTDTGDEIWFTLHGPFEDYDDMDAQIGESLDHYGIAA